MDKQGQEYQWLEWAKELQFIAQAGLTYKTFLTRSVLSAFGKYQPK